MHRDALSHLIQWLGAAPRRPLVIRGARQVGKTWLVRACAEQSKRHLVELNFERDPGISRLFQERDPRRVVRALEAYVGARIDPDTSLLFLDEIQAAPHVLANLRWFAEELPVLPVVAAGSLLDFALADHTFRMPVGRISYLYLEPMSFEEFLEARGQTPLRDFLRTWQPGEDVPEPLHRRALGAYREYLLVGGMPGVVAVWCAASSWLSVAEAQQALITTFRDDFAKYTERIPHARLEKLLYAVPRRLGRKFVYSQVNHEERGSALKQALDLLCRARLCHKVLATDGTGLPLGAGIRERTFKAILLDVGLVSAMLGLSFRDLSDVRDLSMINEGGLAEQAIGQQLRAIESYFVDPMLYYWTREQKGAEAELDYLVQHGPSIVPVEVKTGTTGMLKSLHLFMALRRLPLAVRFNADTPSLTAVDHKTTTGEHAAYTLLSLPFYLSGQVHRLLDVAG